MSKYLMLFCLFFGASYVLKAQSYTDRINTEVTIPESEAHIRFLASDELRGRNTGSHELNIAARYIAEQFRAFGLQPLPGAADYFQPVPFTQTTPPKNGVLTLDKKTYQQGKDFVFLNGNAAKLEKAKVVFAGYGLEADLKGKDVKGKIVIANTGGPEAGGSPGKVFGLSRQKREIAKNMGAAALVELYNQPFAPWNMIVNFMGQPQLELGAPDTEEAPNGMPHLWLYEADKSAVKTMSDGKIKKAGLQIGNLEKKTLWSRNVLAMIPGTDPALRDQYILLSAHYDHVGVGRGQDPQDSIFNGTRDNAVGTVAVLEAARVLGAHPPKRSVIFAAWTAEEKGLLGAKYYVEHPLVPHNKIIYNLNIDGAGYNDTSLVTVIGLERTSAEQLLVKAAQTYGLKAISDPAPEQGLFDRSDNVHFAAQGIPAPTYSMGFTAFDEAISKYYHQTSDNPETVDMQYLLRYFRSYVLAAYLIGDDPEMPYWKAGDKYEAAWKKLHGKD